MAWEIGKSVVGTGSVSRRQGNSGRVVERLVGQRSSVGGIVTLIVGVRPLGGKEPRNRKKRVSERKVEPLKSRLVSVLTIPSSDPP